MTGKKLYNIPDDLKDVLQDARKETGIQANDSELLEDSFALAWMADHWLGYQKHPLPEETAHYLMGISTAYLVGKGALAPVGETKEIQSWKGAVLAGLICYIIKTGEEQFPNLNPRLEALMRFLEEFGKTGGM